MTSREAYNKIRWDQRLDAGKVRVGYQDRFAGVLELSFFDQKLSRDVPWHRIVHFRYDGRIIWDRDGLDLFAELEEDRPDVQSCYRWNGHSWSAPAVDSGLPASDITLVSLNVLFDLFDEVPATEERLPGLLELLKNQNPDLIALQEVTPKLCSLLAEDVWVRRNFCLSQPPDGPDLHPYGPLLLSRFPGRFEHLALASGKSVVKAHLNFQSAPLDLFITHLFSDRTENAAHRRQQQLDEIASYLQPGSQTLLVGDLNTRGLLEVPSLTDLWLMQPQKLGLTFDPAVNRLARQTSRKARGGRLDRIYARGPWHCRRIEVVADSGEVSDHHLLRAEFSPPLIEKPVHRSALVVIPPEDLWQPIQAIRKHHDKSYQRWMPHINLLYGFLPESHFEQAQERLQSRLRHRRPFQLRLRELHRFEHGKSVTLWLKPDTEPPDTLQQIQADCQELFPTCTEQSRRSEFGFTPHLTVASLPKDRPLPGLRPVDIRFEVDALHLISRRAKEPFKSRGSVSLQGRYLVEEPSPPATAHPAFPGLRKMLPGLLFKVGSNGLGLDLCWSDLDCLLIDHSPLQEILALLPEARLVPGRVALFSFRFDGFDIDLQYARYPSQIPLRPPEELSEHQLAQLDAQSRRAVQARLDLLAIKSQVDLEQFRPFLSSVRTWTHQRKIDQPSLGYPGGLAWTVMAARRFQSGRSLETSWTRFLTDLADWPWPQAFSKDPEALGSYAPKQSDKLPVLSPTAPFVNTAPQVTALTRESVLREVRRAQQLVYRNCFNTLFQTFTAPAKKRVVFPIKEDPRDSLGKARAEVVNLLIRLEEDQSFLRPLSLEIEGDKIVLTLVEMGS